MKTVGEIGSVGRKLLRGRTEYPARDAAVLLGHVLGKGSDYVYLHPEERVPEDAEREYLELVDRRSRGEPLAYLRGYQEFMGFRFKVDRRVLIPRPETEVLVETAQRRLAMMLGSRPREIPNLTPSQLGPAPADESRLTPKLLVADVCCGSGNIGISLAKLLPGLIVVGVDISRDALDVARENAEALGVADRVTFVEGDLFEPLEQLGLAGQFDAVTANPPYIPAETLSLLPAEVRDFEPLQALDGGPGGLRLIRRVVYEAPRYLRPGGELFMEIGFDQAGVVREYFREMTAEYDDVTTVLDYAGRERLFVARKR
ncbi:MAG: peptide chain release factor N(5)-glutamine methyltransferase [Firmicutes bacterium]|nr:peptide chain release factor N(5)-glutamine methyltransferase [Candidatus Fermentithermobacillaceae bacterium]